MATAWNHVQNLPIFSVCLCQCEYLQSGSDSSRQVSLALYNNKFITCFHQCFSLNTSTIFSQFERYKRNTKLLLGAIHLRPLPPAIGISAKCLWRGFLIFMCCDLLTIGIWGHPSSPPRHASDATRGWTGWALAHPEFGSTVNPIRGWVPKFATLKSQFYDPF